MTTDETRAATAPRRMIEPDDALAFVLAAAAKNTPERVARADALGLVLAAGIHADRDYPPFPRAMMDGYAVCVADAGKTVRVTGEIAAGTDSDTQIKSGEAVQIMTGAACPSSADAVIEVERITTAAVANDNAKWITLPAEIAPGRNIAPLGSDCPVGTEIARPGDAITPLTIAAAASVGVETFCIIPAPKLAIIITGDELIRTSATPGRVQIRDSNGPMLCALAVAAQLPTAYHTHVEDTAAGLAEALATTADARIVILTGGVSAGKYDLVPAALIAHGAEILFHKVKQKPGKPLLFARKDDTMYFGLPGNPLASHLGFSRYVIAAANVMRGRPRAATPDTFTARLATDMPPTKGRALFRLGTATFDHASGGYQVEPAAMAGSADIFGPHQANCFLRLDVQESPRAAGEKITCAWL